MKDINKQIVDYIKKTWLDKEKNNSAFGRKYDLNEKTVRLMRSDDNYSISLITLIKICQVENLSLEEFCKKAKV
ncbi:hypothetical protein HX082_16430 [Myroides odoratimimus]|uniref:hypothetical protein n=1 Tax=Myroides odoratimimus TaxID=76832 RepID=UPI002578155C|nr:hypothetical protein [Myroides odoratimimus]MDM1510958.1 hypothetical protein [Myroides odoratimimus]MEC4095384.1 hypothetical protein [Myroides odoratimimus]